MFENFHRADHLSHAFNCFDKLWQNSKREVWMSHNKMNVDFYDGRYKAILGISEVVKPACIFYVLYFCRKNADNSCTFVYVHMYL